MAEQRSVDKSLDTDSFWTPVRRRALKVFGVAAAAALSLPTFPDPVERPEPTRVEVVALDPDAAFTPEQLGNVESSLERTSLGLVDVAIKQTLLDPAQRNALESPLQSPDCVIPTERRADEVRSFLPIADSNTIVVAAMSKLECKVESGAVALGNDIDIYGMDSRRPDENVNVLLHELGHPLELGHQNGLDIAVEDGAPGDQLVWNVVQKGSVDLDSKLYGIWSEEYGNSISCNMMGKAGSCDSRQVVLSTPQLQFLAHEQDLELPHTIVDLSKPHADKLPLTEGNWSGEVALAKPVLIGREPEEPSAPRTFQVFTKVSISYEHTSANEELEEGFGIYLSNETDSGVSTLLVGYVPTAKSLRQMRAAYNFDDTPVVLTIGGVEIAFSDTDTVKATYTS